MDAMGHQKQQNKIYRLELWIIRFYNAMNRDNQVDTFEEIPQEAVELLAHMDYHSLVAPFVAIDIRDGLSREQASIKYGVTEGFARAVGERFKYLPRKKHG